MVETIKNEKVTQKIIFQIDSEIKSNNNLISQSRQVIEENRSMILNNYTSSYSGNHSLANKNTEEIFENRNAILLKIKLNNELEEKFVEAEKNKAVVDFFRTSVKHKFIKLRN